MSDIKIYVGGGGGVVTALCYLFYCFIARSGFEITAGHLYGGETL